MTTLPEASPPVALLVATSTPAAAVVALPSTPPAPLIFRELVEPSEVLALLRLRHRIYFEERAYGSIKQMGLDVTAHDARARLLGVFRGEQLVGGLRLVFRSVQPLAPVMRMLRAVMEEKQPEAPAPLLPSEEAFDLAVLGARRAFVDVEIGRLAVDHSGMGPGMVLQVMIATLAVLHLARCRLCLYSCAAERVERYARVSPPRWIIERPVALGIGSDGFVFPRPTVACVASIEDSPHLPQALAFAEELAQTGAIRLSGSDAVRTVSPVLSRAVGE